MDNNDRLKAAEIASYQRINALLRDIADLESSRSQSRNTRVLLVKAALESLDTVERTGAGALAPSACDKVRAAIFYELGIEV